MDQFSLLLSTIQCPFCFSLELIIFFWFGLLLSWTLPQTCSVSVLSNNAKKKIGYFSISATWRKNFWNLMCSSLAWLLPGARLSFRVSTAPRIPFISLMLELLSLSGFIPHWENRGTGDCEHLKTSQFHSHNEWEQFS